ncbi:MAG: hypothetical protein ACXAB2_12005 [Candidatus Hodarchaeales archaeon]|jgi:hypothetical protein
MDEIKKFIDNLGIAAFEANTKIAGFAVVSDSGSLIYQTENWDLTNHTHIISNLIKGESSFVLNNSKFSVVDTSSEGIITTSDMGMGHVIFVPFQGGVLISYVMPQAEPSVALSFLKDYAPRLNGKV